MQKSCRICQSQYEIPPEDLDFYDRVSPTYRGQKYMIPPPDLCRDCRLKHLFVWRNERGLHSRKCDLTGEPIISWISPDKPQPVYKKEAWWSDKWEARDYGRDIDFSRPFFPQLKELIDEVPWLDLLVDKTFNSDYANFCNNIKDCYLVYATNNSQDCYYISYMWGCNDCVDCVQGFDSELCYECNDISKCYSCQYCRNCVNCQDCKFCENCQGCTDCFGCVNLVGKKYHYMNQPLSKEDYEKKVNEIKLDSYEQVQQGKEFFAAHRLKHPMRASRVTQSENCSGDFLKNSKNTHDAFDTSGAEDCKRMWLGSGPLKDCQDVIGVEQTELGYASVVVGVPSVKTAFCMYVWNGVNDVYYSVLSPGSKNCFGCAGLHKGRYSILNKKYSKQEYDVMAAKLIEHMKETGEWGQFLPPELSPFAYNETLANEFFPLSREQAQQEGYKWSNYEAPNPQIGEFKSATDLPDSIKDVPDNAINWIIKCTVTGKPFKITAQELKYYREHGLPLPRKHPDQRHKERMAFRNPPKLYDRTCAKTGAPIKTAYSPDRPEIVWSEEAYLKEFY